MADFTPLIAGKWLTISMWVFIVLAMVSLIWFIMYATLSKKKVPKTSVSGILITSLLFAIAIQLIFIENHISFD